MTEFKKGDRVRVCWESDYNKMVQKSMGLPSNIGRLGIVIETRVNPNMAVYGEENEVLVHMDDNTGVELWVDKNLELLKIEA